MQLSQVSSGIMKNQPHSVSLSLFVIVTINSSDVMSSNKWHDIKSVNIVSYCQNKGIRNIRSQDYSFPGTFVPMMELSFSGPFVPWNIRYLDRSFPGTFVLKTIRSVELSFQVLWTFRSRYSGPFLPRTVRAFVSPAVTGLEQRNKQKRRPMTATVLHSRYTQTVDRRYECHQSVKAVADVYNIKPHQIASSSFAFKNLFWSYFTTMMEC